MSKLTLSLILAIFSGSAYAASQFLAIDVSGGNEAESYPIEEIAAAPVGGWSDEYKTTKIVLRRIDCASPFYVGVFEITQRQWELVMGTRPSYYANEECYAKRPVDNVSYDDIRGAKKGAAYPKSMDVDEKSFVGRLRQKSNLSTLDLPTEKQWKSACRDTQEAYWHENIDDIVKRARFGVNGGYYLTPKAATPQSGADNGTAEVGSYEPNGQGIYDMNGNVCEWCLDACDPADPNVVTLCGGWSAMRPFGKYRVLKGGHCECSVTDCISGIVYGDMSSFRGNTMGLRIVVVR